MADVNDYGIIVWKQIIDYLKWQLNICYNGYLCQQKHLIWHKPYKTSCRLLFQLTVMLVFDKKYVIEPHM